VIENPSTHGPDGRDASGRFTRGNQLGRGNPLAGRAAKLRATLLEAVTPERLATIVDALLCAAERGDLAAIKEVLDRTLGRPSAAELLERLEALERAVEERGNHVH